MELRKDPITGYPVAFAPERAARPHEFPAEVVPGERMGRCPFCLGNEDMTPEAILQPGLSGERSADWRVRVIPNQFPVFSPATTKNATPETNLAGRSGTQNASPCPGMHEVIVESPNHCRSMSDLTGEQFLRVVEVYYERLKMLRDGSEVVQAMIFKNQGHAAGASLEHVHSQLVGIPFVPRTTEDELETAVKFGAKSARKRGLWADIVDREQADSRRIVHQSGLFTVFCPFASRFPYEIWIVPKRNGPEFSAASREEIEPFARLLHRAMAVLEQILPAAAYNFALHTAPFRDARADYYHWHLKITPRIAGIAGYEIGTGAWINTVMPENAAAELREVW